jgi:hypothetical protein
MLLAAPLILPFAELAGITIAGLGMAAASKKVSDFISDNPEISTQILTTLVPGGVGLNALFKDKDAPSTKDIVLGELGKEKGNYSSPDAEGAYSSKRGRIIKALEEAGKIKKGPNKDYDSSKKYKGYKKFYEKADGGRIGFANGGRGYSDYASPSSTTASQDFATQAVSGGQTDYDGGGGGNDQPITEIRPNFNYNIDPFSINPRLNFKNIASIIYLQEFLDKKARGEDPNLEADINFRDQLGNLGIFGNLGRSGNIVGANIPFLQSGLGSLAYNTDTGLAAGLRGNLTEDLSGGVSFQDGQQNVNFNYDKGPFSAGFTFGPEENNIQVGLKMPFADGGRIGYVGGGLATTQDFANALKSVSAGTTYQQQTQAKEYARNEASNLLSQAMRSADPNKGPGLQGIYDTFFKNQNVTGIGPKTFTPDSSGRMIMYSARDRDAILDSMANQMLNTTPYAAPKPIPKTYRTVSPEAQALNMSQSTYEDIIRSGADPKQYYMDYQNRIMAGNPNLLKYGQVIGGPGMSIAGPGTAPGATPPTQAQMNQMMQNNPMGYMDFADLVKTYSADPYKGLQEEIKDMVDGRDTGYMGGQDYYDINVLGLDGRGIAEKYGLQYADGGRIGFANGGDSIINKDLISLFRGQPLFGQTTNQALSSYPSDKMLSGRFFTTDPDIAKSYAKNSSFPSVVKEMKVPQNVLDKAYDFKNRLTNFSTKTFADLPQRKDVLIASKDMLKNYKPSINIPATLSSNFNQGLGFLKNNAIKGLTTLGSLPVQAALATLYPTPANADEVNMNPEDFKNNQILQPNVVPERIAPATYYNSAPNFNADVLREEEDAQYNLPKTNEIINSLLNMKSTVPQMLLSAATKVPGAGLVLGGLSSLSNLIGNSFENRQLTGEGVIVDEFGRSYDADELNAQNALGGYYTDAARSSRRRDSRIQNMLARQAAGKTISQNNLIALQEQAAREQAARETATAALAAQNASTYGTSGATGGYQSSWGGVDSFMSGSGTAADMGSFADGGLISLFVETK